MKKARMMLLFLMVFAILAGCTAEAEKMITVEKNGETYRINQSTNTISHGTHIYNYTCIITTSSNGTSTEKTTIFYPDGSSYTSYVRKGGGINTGHSEVSSDYDPNRYADGEILVRIVEELQEPETKVNWVTVVFGVLVTALGIVDIAKPGLWWKLRYGLYVRDSEPTEFAVLMSRIGGFVCVLVGGFLILRGLLGGTI